MFFSWGCCSKLLKYGWLKMTEMCSLTILEATGLKSRCWQSHTPSGDSEESLFFAASNCCWWLAALGRQSQHSVSASAFILPFLPCVATLPRLSRVLKQLLTKPYIYIYIYIYIYMGFPHSSVGEESACTAGDLGSILGSERSPGEGNSNPL